MTPVNLSRSQKGTVCPTCGHKKTAGAAVCDMCLGLLSGLAGGTRIIQLLGEPMRMGYEKGMLDALMALRSERFYEAKIPEKHHEVHEGKAD
jgi:hypothetical protein